MKKAVPSFKRTAFVRNDFCLFPFCPDFRAIAAGCLLSFADDWGFHEGGIIKNLILLGPFVVHVLHQGNFGAVTFPVNELVDAPDCPQYAVKLLAGHSVLLQVDGLEFDPPLLEVPFGFFCIKAFRLAENLNIQ